MIFLVNLFFSLALLNLLFQLGNLITQSKSNSLDSNFFISIIFGYSILSLIVQYLLIYDSYDLISNVILVSISICLLR